MFNKEGKSVAAERPDVDLNLRPDTYTRVTQHGVRILRQLVGATGTISGSCRRAGQREDQAGQRASSTSTCPTSRRARWCSAASRSPPAADGSAATGSADLTLGGALPGPPSALREFPTGSEITA